MKKQIIMIVALALVSTVQATWQETFKKGAFAVCGLTNTEKAYALANQESSGVSFNVVENFGKNMKMLKQAPCAVLCDAASVTVRAVLALNFFKALDAARKAKTDKFQTFKDRLLRKDVGILAAAVLALHGISYAVAPTK